MASKWRTMLGKKKSPKMVVLDKDFAGIKAGSKLFVAQSFDRPRLSRGNASDVIVDDLGRSNEEPASSFDASKVFV